MTACWEMRGCDEEMQGRCPHNIPGEPCPADCYYAACHRPTHKVATDVNVILNPDLNYDASVKQVCRVCEFFLTRGPAAETAVRNAERQGSPTRFLL